MWSFQKLLVLPTIFGFLSVASGVFFYPKPQSSLVEHILVDTHGAHSSGFADAITPCSKCSSQNPFDAFSFITVNRPINIRLMVYLANYVSGNQSMGRTTAAQWIRVAFHDFVTADVAAGTGGLDASIGFETLRAENSGTAFNDSFSFFRRYVNPVISSKYILSHYLYKLSTESGYDSEASKLFSYSRQKKS